MSKDLHIRRITLREVRMPLREPFVSSAGVQSTRRILLVELIDAGGVTAWGECVAQERPDYLPETVDTAAMVIRQWLAPILLKTTFRRPEEVRPVLDRHVRGHQMAKAALEMPVWALAAVRNGISLAASIGGAREAVATGISLGIQADANTLVDRVGAAVRAGYRRIKLKIQPGADVEPVAAVREALGPGVPLMVDANTAYTLEDLPVLRRLDDYGLLMIEQPLHWDDLAGHARLQETLRTPICLDESVTGIERAEAMICLGSARVLNLKPGRVGGLAASIEIHDLCGRHGLPVWCGGMLETGIGRAYNMALASLPNFSLPGDLSPSSRYWERDIVSPEWTMDAEGMVRVPLERPGLGVEVDEERVEELTVWREVIE